MLPLIIDVLLSLGIGILALYLICRAFVVIGEIALSTLGILGFKDKTPVYTKRVYIERYNKSMSNKKDIKNALYKWLISDILIVCLIIKYACRSQYIPIVSLSLIGFVINLIVFGCLRICVDNIDKVLYIVKEFKDE